MPRPRGHHHRHGRGRPPADETLYGGDAGRDVIEVLARGRDDYVSGTPGDDVLVGGAGRDTAVYVSAGDSVSGFEVVRN